MKNLGLRKSLVAIGAVGICCYGIWQGLLVWRRSESVESASLTVLEAFRRKDVATLWNYSHRGERDAFKMDRATFERFFAEYVWPNTGKAMLGEMVPRRRSDGKLQEVTQLYDLDGRELALNYIVFKTKEGPRANVITPAVFLVFDAKYGTEHANKAGSKRWFETRLTGARRDRQILESYGIMGTKDSPPGQPMVTWDRDIGIIESYLAKVRASHASSQSQ